MAKGSDTEVEEVSVTRRRFMSYVGWGSFVSFWGGVTAASTRFFFPKVLYEPSLRFIAGKPEDYQPGEVSTRMKKEQAVWIIRNDKGIYALVSICTHLGCTPIWHAAEDRIKCPCHGSNFLVDGVNVAGPAPEPLFRAAISLDLAGNIVIDKSQQANAPDVRDEPPFFLPLSA